MIGGFQALAAKQAPCKCCGATAALYGVVDFHKNCLNVQHPALAPSGIPIYYYACPVCRFLFTTAFDHFTKDDFLSYIYNRDYLLVDPEYREVRPRGNASAICSLFPGVKPQRVLDYGGGEGLLAELLRSTGQFQIDTYDPFVPSHATRPSCRYDCIISFEVLEHTTDPRQTIADMNDLLMERGLILFSTLLQPADIDQQGLNWWYAGPRNGHVSLFSRSSLVELVKPLGFTLASFNDSMHVLFREIPDFAQHFIRQT
jgi:SAM-dependent methyltransferase